MMLGEWCVCVCVCVCVWCMCNSEPNSLINTLTLPVVHTPFLCCVPLVILLSLTSPGCGNWLVVLTTSSMEHPC